MSKNLPVASLKKGDKFEFLIGRLDESKPAVMIVTRDPAVNSIANSCHFRYQADDGAVDTDRRWDGAQSWNGTPDVQVRLLEGRPVVTAPALSTPPAVAPALAAEVPVEAETTRKPVKKRAPKR